MFLRFIVFVVLCFSVLFSNIGFSQINSFKNYSPFTQHGSFSDEKIPNSDSNTDADSLMHDDFNLLFGFGVCHVIMPYAEIGFNYKMIYVTGEICYMVFGAYVGFCGQCEFFSRGKHSLSLSTNYGLFGGIGILDPFHIIGGGLEYRYRISKSVVHLFGRLSMQANYFEMISKKDADTSPGLQCGLLFKI